MQLTMTPTITYGPWLPFSFVDKCARLAAMLPPPAQYVSPALMALGTDADRIRIGPLKVIVAAPHDLHPIALRHDYEAPAIGCVAGWISEED